MKMKVVAPSVGESITEVSILKWHKASGQMVKTGEVLLEIESDKATVEVVAEGNGVLTISRNEGERVNVGDTLAEIDSDAQASAAPPAAAVTKPAAPSVAPPPPPAMSAKAAGGAPGSEPLGPAARKLIHDNHLENTPIAATGRGGRVTKGDVLNFLSGAPAQATATAPAHAPAPAPTAAAAPAAVAAPRETHPGERRVPMTRIRNRIAERLKQVQNDAAILTTFNEVDMKPVMDLRNQYKDKFKQKYNLPMSFMTFFTRASVEALKQIPGINAYIEGNDILYHDYQDIGIAVGTERGLVVPVLRDAGNLGFVEIDKGINDLALKAKNNKLSIADMSGGTFTITNGGTYGSLMSTPILNPPQSGILGMHKIMDRPIVVDGQIVARPMMFVALSYDHRLVDGKEAVTFLVTLKDYLENPKKLNLDFLNGL